jgi:hypothetical protein
VNGEQGTPAWRAKQLRERHLALADMALSLLAEEAVTQLNLIRRIIAGGDDPLPGAPLVSAALRADHALAVLRTLKEVGT